MIIKKGEKVMNKKKKKGFTLIELIVVIAILGILAAIAIPRLGGFTESAKQADDKELTAVIANSSAQYLASHQEVTAVDATVATGHITPAALITALNSANLIDSTITDLATLEGKLKSTEYSTGTGFTIGYAGGTVTVIMNGATLGDYTITK